MHYFPAVCFLHTSYVWICAIRAGCAGFIFLLSLQAHNCRFRIIDFCQMPLPPHRISFALIEKHG